MKEKPQPLQLLFSYTNTSSNVRTRRGETVPPVIGFVSDAFPPKKKTEKGVSVNIVSTTKRNTMKKLHLEVPKRPYYVLPNLLVWTLTVFPGGAAVK